MTNKLQVRDANLPQRYHQNEVFTGEFQYQIPQMQFSSPIQTSPDAVPTSEISQNSTSLPENTSNSSSTTPSSNLDMTNSSSPALVYIISISLSLDTTNSKYVFTPLLSYDVSKPCLFTYDYSREFFIRTSFRTNLYTYNAFYHFSYATCLLLLYACTTVLLYTSTINR